MQTRIFRGSVLLFVVLFLAAGLSFHPGVVFNQSSISQNTVQAEATGPFYFPQIYNCQLSSRPLVNGDFELGEHAWTQTSATNFVRLSPSGITPHRGTWIADFPYAIVGKQSTLEQTFTVPDCYPWMSFWWTTNTPNAVCDGIGGECTSLFLTTVNGTVISTIGAGIKSVPWSKTWLNLTPYRGQTIKLGFYNNFVDNTAGGNSSDMAIDDLEFYQYPDEPFILPARDVR